MIIRHSSKYKPNGEFWHDGRRVNISRVFGGVGLLGAVKFAVLLGEEQFFQESHFFVLAEGETGPDDSLADLVDICRRLDATFGNQRWFGRLDKNVEEVLAVCNKQAYITGVRNVCITDTPRIGEWIDEHMAIVHMLVRPTEKRLHFFDESMIAAELKSLPTRHIRADEWPRATAIACVVAGMLRYSGEQINAEDLAPDPEPMY